MITHPEMVKALVKPGQQILDETGHRDRRVLTRAILNHIRAGESLDNAKKQVFNRNTKYDEPPFQGLAEWKNWTPQSVDALHMAVGLAGETAEVLQKIFHCIIDPDFHQLTDSELEEELGDVEFYMEGLRQALELTREGCLENNINKLGKRYEGFEYSDKKAQDRADKA